MTTAYDTAHDSGVVRAHMNGLEQRSGQLSRCP